MRSEVVTDTVEAALATRERVLGARLEAEHKALDSLARYKFEMFGYWAAAWVKFNALLPNADRLGNPFRDLVALARSRGFGPGVSRQEGLARLPQEPGIVGPAEEGTDPLLGPLQEAAEAFVRAYREPVFPSPRAGAPALLLSDEAARQAFLAEAFLAFDAALDKL